MMSKYTEGPWEIGDEEDIAADEEVYEWRVAIRGEGFEMAASYNPNLEQARANARLIAAAPDLLAACETAVHALRSYQYGNSAPALAEEVADLVAAAIAKARGGEE